MSVTLEWHCKPGGGLFLGVRYHFPTSIEEQGNYNLITIGFIVFSIKIEFITK